ncbi:MAG: hypothetical protein K2P09_05350 [Erysipelotrichales bacterium]|nr:hypothetical protein [Erysipelotrichales bacterium]
MQKKFKEYRMFIVCFILFLFFLGMGIYSLIEGEKTKVIAMSLLSLIAFGLLVGRYKIVLFEDAMIVYEWKIFAMLPVMIDYKDIQFIEKKSKHHLVVQHKRLTHIYVFNSDVFMNTYDDLKKSDGKE